MSCLENLIESVLLTVIKSKGKFCCLFSLLSRYEKENADKYLIQVEWFNEMMKEGSDTID